MISFIDEHRGVFGIEPILETIADCPVNLSRECRQAPGRGSPVGPRPQRYQPEDRDTTCLRAELSRLWRSEGLEAIEARRLRRRPLHCRSVDEVDEPARHHSRKGDPHDTLGQDDPERTLKLFPPVPETSDFFL